MARNERSIWLTEQTGNLLGAMVTRDVKGAQDALEEIARREDGPGVMMACYAAAEVTRRIAFPDFTRGDGSLNQTTMLGVELNPAKNVPPSHVWAARFFAAYCNGDDATTEALFFGTMNSDRKEHAGGVIALLKLCADVIRDDLERKQK